MASIKEPTGEEGQTQPWRAWWPPKESEIQIMADDELKAKPWINWKPDPKNPNAKPWLQWVPRNSHTVNLQSASDAKPASGFEPSGAQPDTSSSPQPHPAPPPSEPASSNAEGG